jgi:hypothetical protein
MENNELNILKKISKVEAPPFLLISIEAKIETLKPKRLNVGWSIGGSLAFSLIVVLNVMVIKNKVNNNGSQIEVMAEVFYTSSDNVLYNE